MEKKKFARWQWTTLRKEGRIRYFRRDKTYLLRTSNGEMTITDCVAGSDFRIAYQEMMLLSKTKVLIVE